MPISAELFDLARQSAIQEATEKVRVFLLAHRDLAYSGEELVSELNLPAPILSEALEDLEDSQLVESRIVREDVYFRAVGTVEFPQGDSQH